MIEDALDTFSQIPYPGEWRLQAKCRGVTHVNFFPEVGDNRAAREAQVFCYDCPVLNNVVNTEFNILWSMAHGELWDRRPAEKWLLKKQLNQKGNKNGCLEQAPKNPTCLHKQRLRQVHTCVLTKKDCEDQIYQHSVRQHKRNVLNTCVYTATKPHKD